MGDSGVQLSETMPRNHKLVMGVCPLLMFPIEPTGIHTLPWVVSLRRHKARMREGAAPLATAQHALNRSFGAPYGLCP